MEGKNKETKQACSNHLNSPDTFTQCFTFGKSNIQLEHGGPIECLEFLLA